MVGKARLRFSYRRRLPCSIFLCSFVYPQIFLLLVNERSHILVVGRLQVLIKNKFMKHQEYLKIIEKEIQRINKIIDYKIIHGEEYTRESREHKLLLKKIRQNTRKSFFNNSFFFARLFQY